jgi:Endonuclease-reverse transcriptase
MGYTITATQAPSIHQGGIALAWRQKPGFSVESVTLHGPNILTFQLVSSGYRWLIVAVYLSPNNMATEICEQLIQIRNKYTTLPIIVTGDLNIDLQANTFNQRDQEIHDTMEIIGVTNMIKYFRQRRNFRHGCTWRQMREGRLIRSTCDYVLSDDSRKRFKRIRITCPRHFDSDHYAICFALFSKQPKQHQRYVQQRKAFPLHFDPTKTTDADTLLTQLPLPYQQNANRGTNIITNTLIISTTIPHHNLHHPTILHTNIKILKTFKTLQTLTTHISPCLASNLVPNQMSNHTTNQMSNHNTNHGSQITPGGLSTNELLLAARIIKL